MLELELSASPAAVPAIDKPKRSVVLWQKITITVPARLARFMRKLQDRHWKGARIVLSHAGSDALAELVNLIPIARDFLGRGPKKCAKGQADWKEFVRMRDELARSIHQLRNKMNAFAEAVQVRAPRRSRSRRH